MSSDDSITLGPREGFIAVAGEPGNIADAGKITFERSGIKASRTGSEYRFWKTWPGF